MAVHLKSWPGVDTGKYRNKYGAVRVLYCPRCEDICDTKICPKCKEKVLSFDSHAEYRRYRELRLLEKFDKISNLVCQPKYPMILNDILICTYFADFRYNENDGSEVVEDVKGVKTETYKLKKNLMKALYGIDILET